MVEKGVLWKWKRVCVQDLETWEAEAYSHGTTQYSRCPKMGLVFITLITVSNQSCHLSLLPHSPLCFLTFTLYRSLPAVSPAVFGVNHSRTWLLKALPANERRPALWLMCHMSFVYLAVFITRPTQRLSSTYFCSHSHLSFHKRTPEVIITQEWRHDSVIWQWSKKT